MTTSTLPSVLLVDDITEEREALAAILARDGFDVCCAEDDLQASPDDPRHVDVVVSKLALRGNGHGMRLVKSWRRAHPQVPVVAIAGENEVHPAVKAMQLGAADCISQPIDPEKLTSTLRRVLSIRRGEDDTQSDRIVSDHAERFHGMIGRSPLMRKVFAQAGHVAPTDSTVLITGATGTGKELLAHAIHKLSDRSAGPYLAVNVAAVPHTLIESELFGHEKGAFTDAATERIGRFEAADGGTLFIDEIGDLRLESQAKLLRVLETRVINRVGSNRDIDVDVRVVAATSRNLEQMIQSGKFREDLYYRLNVVRIEIPELRRRPEDISLLADCFLNDLAAKNGSKPAELSEELRAYFQAHPWPGNVRQLKNCLESMLVMAGGHTLTMADLPPMLDNMGQHRGLTDLPLAGIQLERLEREAIRQTLKQNKGNRTRTAEILGISVRTLQRKLKQWNGQLLAS